jgi:hypothetical protein
MVTPAFSAAFLTSSWTRRRIESSIEGLPVGCVGQCRPHR